jgi:acyl-CoA synthetase (AMP-forming)/AMP-acid ligase II
LRSPSLREIPKKFVIGLPVPGAVSWASLRRTEPRAKVPELGEDVPALLTFTAASNGQARAAMRTHGFLLAQQRVFEETLQLRTGETDLATRPGLLLANLAAGVTSLIPDTDLRQPGDFDPEPVLPQIQRHRPHSCVASPGFFECLAQYCLDRDSILPSFTKLFTCGVPVFPRLLDQLKDLAPHARAVALYGSGEAEPIACIARDDMHADDLIAMLDGRGLLAGSPVSAIQVRILREQCDWSVGTYAQTEFDTACAPVGQPGEIVVHGPHVLTDCLHGIGDEETKLKVDGAVWHRTGDAGYFDNRGRLWLLGRCSARIEDAHGVLYPLAAETVVYQDRRVKKTAVVAHRGRRCLAVELYSHRVDLDMRALKETAAPAKIEEVRVFEHIPVDKRHNATIDYPALHRMLEMP